jgi:response regulator of citrate/malate metabolism
MENNTQIKILIGLEDDMPKNEIVENLSEFYSVVTVKDCEEAYHTIHSFDPDLAILDYSLSKLHPIDLHEGIAMVHSYVHVVICATVENLEVAERVWSRRAMDFIVKPITSGRFVQDVHKIIRYIIDKRELTQLRKRIKAIEDQIGTLKGKTE